MKYSKPWLSYQNQINLLVSRGLIVNDLDDAISFLSHVSYFRLSAYFIPFQQVKDTFNPGTTFQQIKDTYTFDRELRLLVFDAIERIEVSIRGKIVYYLSDRYGPFFLHNSSIFKPAQIRSNGITNHYYTDLQNSIIKSLNKKQPEVFIKAYKDKYTSETFPPAWMTIELLTLGELSEMYSNLIHESDKQAIASTYNLPHKVFNSWLHALTYVRNLCCHHGRLWNRDLGIEPFKLNADPSKKRNLWLGAFQLDNRRTFYLISLVKYFLNSINPTSRFGLKLKELIKKHPTVPYQYMGIPSDPATGKPIDWTAIPVWQ